MISPARACLCGRCTGVAEPLRVVGEGERVLALESREGTRASRRVEEGLSRSFSGGGGMHLRSLGYSSGAGAGLPWEAQGFELNPEQIGFR